MFIDISYFKGGLHIPNIVGDMEQEFNEDYLIPYEKEILIRVLGERLYWQFIDGLEQSAVLQKWDDLLNGANYLIDGEIYYWNGFVNDEKDSLITPYVYYNYLQQNTQQLTGLGVSINNKENATEYDPNRKLVWSNNQASRKIGNTEKTNTLFSFLKAKEVDYPDWLFTELEEINILGI